MLTKLIVVNPDQPIQVDNHTYHHYQQKQCIFNAQNLRTHPKITILFNTYSTPLRAGAVLEDARGSNAAFQQDPMSKQPCKKYNKKTHSKNCLKKVQNLKHDLSQT